MAKDINIHVKAENVEATKAQLESLGFSVSEVGVKTSRAGGWIRDAFTALVGPLGIAGLVTLAVAGIRKIIAAFDDMKRAASDAVHELANQQRAAASFFEAFDAYGGPQRKAALAQARGLQAATGLPLEASMQLLEAQRRTFGAVTPQGTQQFAAYWQLHAGAATTDLIRWMGESKITAPQRQGEIMRMLSAVSGRAGLRDEELIAALTTQGEKFRYLGWTPEQQIENLGKVLVPGESRRDLRMLFGAIEGLTEEKARKLGAPSAVAADEARRFQWISQRPELFQKAFGTAAPTMARLFAPAAPITPISAEEEARRFAEWQKTEEARLEQTRGRVIQPFVSPVKTTEALIREHGKSYLEYLRINDRLKYEMLKAIPGGEQFRYEMAAYELYKTIYPPEYETVVIEGMYGGKRPKFAWPEIPLEQRLAGVEQGAQTINIYNIGQVYTPRVGDDQRGPRAPASLK